MLHRRIDELRDFGEGDDLIELAPYFAASHAKNGAVEVHVLPSGELGMKSRSDFQQRSDASSE